MNNPKTGKRDAPRGFKQFLGKWKRLQRELRELRQEGDANQLLLLAEELYVFLDEWEREIQCSDILSRTPDDVRSPAGHLVN